MTTAAAACLCAGHLVRHAGRRAAEAADGPAGDRRAANCRAEAPVGHHRHVADHRHRPTDRQARGRRNRGGARGVLRRAPAWQVPGEPSGSPATELQLVRRQAARHHLVPHRLRAAVAAMRRYWTPSMWVTVVAESARRWSRRPSGMSVSRTGTAPRGRPRSTAPATRCTSTARPPVRSLPHKANSQQRVRSRGVEAGRPPGRPDRGARAGRTARTRASMPAAATCTTHRRPVKRVGKHKIWSRNYVVRRIV